MDDLTSRSTQRCCRRRDRSPRRTSPRRSPLPVINRSRSGSQSCACARRCATRNPAFLLVRRYANVVPLTPRKPFLLLQRCINCGVRLTYDHPTAERASCHSGRALVGAVIFVLGSAVATAFFASIYARGIFQDGVYYLYRIAEKQSFHLVDPARTTVQALRQAPIVLLTQFTELTLFERGQVFTFVMLILPITSCAICWWIAPAGRKGWIVFPILNLAVGIGATSFNAIGETIPATSVWWCMMFLLFFRTRDLASQFLFLTLCLLAFQLHEGAFPLMLVLLACCALRLRQATRRPERIFLTLSVLLIASVTIYELTWVVKPRVPADRAMVLHGLVSFLYVFRDGHLNLPLVTGTVALVVLAAAIFTTSALPNSRVRARHLARSFCIFSAAAAITSLLAESSFAPGAQVMARYHPVFVSFGLGLAMLAFDAWRIPERVWLQPATLVIVCALALAQATADIAATLRWREYLADLQGRLTLTRGLVRWDDTLVTGDPARDVNWRLMSMEWVIPLVCIVISKDGVVTTMIDPRPEMTFRPIDPSRPDLLPVIRGVDFSAYRAAAVQKWK